MPIKPEILALKMPAGIFPLAIEIITTEEETVEGKQAKKKNAIHHCDCVPLLMKSNEVKTIKGTIIKVVHCISTCSLQFFNPKRSLSGLNFRP